MTFVTVAMILLLLSFYILTSLDWASRGSRSYFLAGLFISIPYFSFNLTGAHLVVCLLYAGYLVLVAQNRDEVDLWDMLFIPAIFLPFDQSVLYLIPLVYLYLKRDKNTKTYIIIILLYFVNTLMLSYTSELSTLLGLLLFLNIIYGRNDIKLEKQRYLCLFSIFVLFQNSDALYGYPFVIFSLIVGLCGFLANSKEIDRTLYLALGFFIALKIPEDVLLWGSLLMMSFPVIIKIDTMKNRYLFEKFLLVAVTILGLILIKKYNLDIQKQLAVIIFAILMIKMSKNIVLTHCRGELIYRILISMLGIGVSFLWI